MSTGLVYPPGSVTPTEELIELSKIVSEYDGIYDSHMRNEGTWVIDIFSHPRLPASLVARPYDVRPVPPVVLVIYLTPLVPLS